MRPSKMAVLISQSSTWPWPPPSTVTTTERPPRSIFICSAVSVTSSCARSAERGRSLVVTVDFMELLLKVGRRARCGAQLYFCKGYATLRVSSAENAGGSATHVLSRRRGMRPSNAMFYRCEIGSKCADAPHSSHTSCWLTALHAQGLDDCWRHEARTQEMRT